jgi:restriction endonuclease S subunit
VTTQIANLFLYLPTIADQESIVAFLEQENAQIDTLISKTEETMAHLQEYRAALISAAVTGKIDVRGEV